MVKRKKKRKIYRIAYNPKGRGDDNWYWVEE